LAEGELWQYHAYDYGLRRVLQNDFSRVSPIDRNGRWFDEALVLDAEDLFRPTVRKRGSA
jgi:hypothetical protein